MKKSKPSKSSKKEEKKTLSIEQIPKKRLWLYRLIALIIIPIIFFSLLELSLRLFDFGYPSTALIEKTENDTCYVYDNSKFSKRFFPSRLEQEFVPIRFTANKPNGVIRLFILGGSAAQGIPDPAYSFSRILNVMLEEQYSNVQFEIIPLAMTAINSHVVLEIAKECVEYDPDLFIVYLGNNEVVGPYGPGTILTPIISNSFLLDLTLKFKSTKISQLLTQIFEKLTLLKSPFTKWEGMEMFAKNQISRDDSRLNFAYQNFKNNLESLNEICHDNNIKILYSTVATNLKDCPPFSSKHISGIIDTDLHKWEDIYSAGITFERAGDFNSAISKYLEAEKIDGQYADLNFRLGRCYYKIGNFEQAKEFYIKAREYDSNRFRADNKINEIIRNSSAEIAGLTFLADASEKMESQSPNQIIGNEFLFEHVHLNFQGNYLVANTILNELEFVFNEKLNAKKRNENVTISEAEAAISLAYGDYEHYRVSDLVLNGFIKQPPFTYQLYHSEHILQLEAELDSLHKFILLQQPDVTISLFEKALIRRPNDWFLHNKFADYLANDNISKYQDAMEHYSTVKKFIPHDPNILVKYGTVLAKLGKLYEALDNFKEAVDADHEFAKAYFNLGLIYQKLNDQDQSITSYNNAISYDPTYSKAYNNLAFIYSNKGDNNNALETIDIGLKYIPEDLLLNYNKAMILNKSNRKSEAIEQLKHLIKLSPNDSKMQEILNEWTNNKR